MDLNYNPAPLPTTEHGHVCGGCGTVQPGCPLLGCGETFDAPAGFRCGTCANFLRGGRLTATPYNRAPRA